MAFFQLYYCGFLPWVPTRWLHRLYR